MGSALFWMTPFRAWQAPLMSLLIIVSGTLGALVMSSVKRSLGAVRLDTSMMLTRGALDEWKCCSSQRLFSTTQQSSFS